MTTLIAYYDCSNWDSSIEVMNPKGKEKSFRLCAYSQTGEELLKEEHKIAGHATLRVKLNERLAGHQGQVIVEHIDDDDDEFPAVMTLCPEGVDFKQGNRYYPFIRLDD
jgi:hypothetical protein